MWNMNFKFRSWASLQSNQKEAKLSLPKGVSKSFLESHSEIPYMGLSIKGTLWHGEQRLWQYHWTCFIQLKCFIRFICLGEGIKLKFHPVTVILLGGCFCFCNTHHFYTEGILTWISFPNWDSNSYLMAKRL